MENYHLFTSESVTVGHPDKLADQISDAILDACLEADPLSRVAAEALVSHGQIILAGEITTLAEFDAEKIARQTVFDAGYRSCGGIEVSSCGFQNMIARQSPEIGQAVERGGAGDQGMMFGYACRDTEELMPLPIQVAHELTWQLKTVREEEPELGLLPDGKTQVTVAYLEGVPSRFETVVISTQHSENLSERDVEEIVKKRILSPILAKYMKYANPDLKVFVNPSGSFVVGGPEADTGLTGRKIIVDTYGGMSRHGGGSFSGKDPTKVDRSAAYIARLLAKSVVASNLADTCEIHLAYAIGRAEPVAVGVHTFGTEKIPVADIEALLLKRFDLTPAGIIDRLGLRRPIYLETAKNGHFGKPQFPWEQPEELSG